ncbi:PLP-dependent aminotransferase family protein [Hydrogenophaga defluvii]|uniref:PLP-dependent aminotransferase family protein n=1 Tax=Hydrogenophaga defluvii TaxID=249410 RepID=A0ABW2S812_9BURK
MAATPSPDLIATEQPLPDTPVKGLSPRLYAQLAQRLARLIDSGALKAGSRLPSIRELAANEGVSISTVNQALRQLEEQGLVLAKPKAGYFVRRGRRATSTLVTTTPPLRSFTLEAQRRSESFATLEQPGDRACFGGYLPQESDLFDEERLRIAMGRASRLHRQSLTRYNNADMGTPALRQAVARRALHMGCTLAAEHIITTASCTQAVSLCLQAVTQPGDVVALESPTYFGYIDLLEALGLRALEIPTHPRNGISLPALELALDTQPVKAVLLAPTLSNPLGSVMPLANKQALVRLLTARGLPLIEDVVFNDLLASDERRKAAKAFDTDGFVMVCGSFAKTLSPGLRLGWVEAGRWRDTVANRKRLQGAATNVILEEALADLLTQGFYEANLRRINLATRHRLKEARHIVTEHFPRGTRVSNPPAGYALWVELPEGTDCMALFRLCAAQGITFGPGPLFTATDRYRNCLRLSFSGAWDVPTQEALAVVGQMACRVVASADTSHPMAA